MSHRVEPDACTTQLDLARAYIDMGDPDGAQELLRDVVKNGTPEQREQASMLALVNGINTNYPDGHVITISTPTTAPGGWTEDMFK